MLRKFVLAAMLLVPLALPTGPSHARTVTLPDPASDATAPANAGMQRIVLAGGCFWGIQAVFEHVKGVSKATSGYSGGTVKNPDYETVSSGSTGHAESVDITYDPTQVSFGQLLKVFFSVAHDPTELNYQGPDTGTQYRSAIFFTTPDQERVAKAYIAQLNAAKVFSDSIVTQLAPLQAFYPAEDYHQDYALIHPDSAYIAINDLPKVANLKSEFPGLFVPYKGS